MPTTVDQPDAEPGPGGGAPANDEAAIVDTLRSTFDRGVTRSLDWRRSQLEALSAMLTDHESEFAAALATDLGKSAIEAWTTEIGFSISDIDHQLANLRSWAAPRKVWLPLMFRPGSARVVPEPKGVALVIAPWNYPVQLLVAPMAAAIAAGNAVVAKPSERAPATAEALSRFCAEYLDQQALRVVQGGVDTSTALLEQRFDHIFFTGGIQVGKIVMRAAAEHLTPVTLELGGKSPAIVTADADVEVAARRLVWGKFTNAGQTCVAPDYVLVDATIRAALLDAIEASIDEFYGPDPQLSDDYGRIIGADHFERLQQMLDDEGRGELIVGGHADAAQRYIAPTVLLDPADGAAVMADEIFGPILPVFTVASTDQAIAAVNARPKPLALYVFGGDDVDRVLAATSSGAAGVNNTLLHVGVPDLPFGGVGQSGLGAYHGQAGFDTFSHLRSVYRRAVKPDPSIAYPPYTNLKQRLLRRFT